jgi:uncharacterized protein (TIGR03067 family)
MRLFSLVALLAMGVTACPSLVADDSEPDLAGLQGTWEIVEASVNGKPQTDEARKAGFKIICEGRKMTLHTVDAGGRVHSFTLDPSKKPKAIDIDVTVDGTTKGRMLFLAIYDLGQDELKLCMPIQSTEKRPTAFCEDDSQGLIFYRLKRVATAQGRKAEPSNAADSR